MNVGEFRMVGEMPPSVNQTTYGRKVEIRAESDLEALDGRKGYSAELFPEAQNKKLRAEVDVLQCENARLKKSLQEAETKVQVKLNDLPSPLKGLGRSSDLAASKIVELSKKVRELSAKLGAAENKANSAEAQLSVYMASQQMNLNDELKDDQLNDNTIESEKEQQIKELADKLNAANNKLCESRNQVQSLKQELKMVQKALVSEVGDEASTASIFSGNANNWRGRAQQITNLQRKVTELQNKLSATDLIGKEKSALSMAINEKHAEKEKVASLTKELDVLREELADFKNKGEAAKARIKVLSTDLNSNKVALQSLQNKNANDEQSISKLTTQLATLMEKAQERENNITKQLNNKIDEMSRELRQEKTKCEQLKEIIADRDLKISKVEERLKLANSSLISSNGFHPGTPSDSSSNSPQIQDDLRPLSRCSSVDRQMVSPGMPPLQTSEAERLRLMELATVLNKRVDHERRELDKAMDELRKEKQRGAKLEMKLARLEMEKFGGSRATHYRNASASSTSSKTSNSMEMETLKDRCELLQEKCLALEARLETIRREKEEEAKMYMNIVEETRQVVKDHMKPIRTSCWSSTSLP